MSTVIVSLRKHAQEARVISIYRSRKRTSTHKERAPRVAVKRASRLGKSSSHTHAHIHTEKGLSHLELQQAHFVSIMGKTKAEKVQTELAPLTKRNNSLIEQLHRFDTVIGNVTEDKRIQSTDRIKKCDDLWGMFEETRSKIESLVEDENLNDQVKQGREFEDNYFEFLARARRVVDFDPQVIEEKEKQRPHMLPLSYVLRYNNEDVSNKKSVEKETRDVDVNTTNTVLPENPAVYEPPGTSKPIADMDDEDIICCESEGSLDSFTIEDTVHEHLVPLEPYNKVASYNVEHVKPYACLIPGCHKRYKNINGMRYHSKHGHSGCNNKSKKDFSCFCGKNYKTIYGLKTHKMIHQNYGFEPKRSSHKENKPSKTSSTPRILAKLDKNEKKVAVKHAIGYKDPNVITSPFSSPPPNNIFCYKPSSDCNFFPDYASKF